ncbi:hypothetical protein OM427_28650, partial [Halomonas sp. 18H]
MGLEQMSHLVTYVASATIGYYANQGAWVDEDFRQKLVTAWLQENGHAASFWKLSKLAITADGVARHIVYEMPELVETFPTLSNEDKNEMYGEVFVFSQKALLYKGIT